MDKILIVSDATYAEGDSAVIASSQEIDQLKAGALAMLFPNGGLVPISGIASSKETLFQFIVGTNDGLLRGGLINRGSMQYEKIVTVAAVPKVMTLALGSLDTTNAGTAGVNIGYGEIFLPFDKSSYLTYDIGFQAGATVADVVAKLRAAINADENQSVVASGSGTDIIFTGGKDNFFAVGTDALAEVYTATVGTDYVAPVNTGAQILEAELIGSAHSGNERSNTYGAEAYKQRPMADTSATYTTYHFRFTGSYGMPTSKPWVFDNSLTIAVDDAATAFITAFDTFLATV